MLFLQYHSNTPFYSIYIPATLYYYSILRYAKLHFCV